MKNLSMYSVSILFYLLLPFFTFEQEVKTEQMSTVSSELTKDYVSENDFKAVDPDPILDGTEKRRRNPIFELCTQRCGEPVTLTSQICFQQCVQYYFSILKGKF